jgi:hypothetical protein
MFQLNYVINIYQIYFNTEVSSSVHNNESLGLIKCRKFLNQLIEYQLTNNEYALRANYS